jgi:hypothetical protein
MSARNIPVQPLSVLDTVDSLRSYVQKIDVQAAKLGVDLNRTLEMKGIKIANIDDPIKDGKLARLELFVMYLHARQELLVNYLINEEESNADDCKEDLSLSNSVADVNNLTAKIPLMNPYASEQLLEKPPLVRGQRPSKN